MRQENAGAKNTVASVLCVVPCLNEAAYLDGLIAKLLGEADRINLKLVVVDGGSTDGSQAIVRRRMGQDARLTLLDNPKRVQSAAVNKAVDVYGDGAEFHADYYNSFVIQPMLVEVVAEVTVKSGVACVTVSV